MFRSSQPPQDPVYEKINVNISQNKTESVSKSENYPSAEATIVKQQHPLKTPPLEYLPQVTTTVTGKKGEKGSRSEADADSLRDKENTYQALIPQQQQPTDQSDYQSLTCYTQHKEYCNIPPPLPPKPETDS